MGPLPEQGREARLHGQAQAQHPRRQGRHRRQLKARRMMMRNQQGCHLPLISCFCFVRLFFVAVVNHGTAPTFSALWLSFFPSFLLSLFLSVSLPHSPFFLSLSLFFFHASAQSGKGGKLVPGV